MPNPKNYDIYHDMEKAKGQAAVGSGLYFFRSDKAGEKRCLIFGHGGQLWASGRFDLPAGIELRFWQQNHGDALLTNPGYAVKGQVKPAEADMQIITGPSTGIPNYSLFKGVGYHWEKMSSDYADIRGAMDYMQGKGDDWTPHVVTIRNRGWAFGHYQTLSSIISAIKRHAPQITEFHVACCRGDHTGQVKSSIKWRLFS
ncbi:hypothetical protein IGB42_00446 [Andreprevotia sp. IGB-42]|nr:hypothetical protein IGB42_00446 [Andreprevotia sp. IGB-42]